MNVKRDSVAAILQRYHEVGDVKTRLGSGRKRKLTVATALSVMEDLWSYLNRKLQAAKNTTIQGLKQALPREWNDVPLHEIRVSVESMPRRLEDWRKYSVHAPLLI